MLRKILSLVLNFNHDPYRRTTRRVAKRIPRYEDRLQVSERPIRERSEESVPELDPPSNVQRLEDNERIQRSSTYRLPKQSERMGKKCEEIPDPWD